MGGHIQRGISRILCARAYLDLLAFCTPSPQNYMRVISGTGQGALTLSFASHESNFKVPSDCYTMAAVLGLATERASHARKCPRCNEPPPLVSWVFSSSTVSCTSLSGERSTTAMLMDHIPGACDVGTSFKCTIRLSTCMKSSWC
jgi:hypothetical protein